MCPRAVEGPDVTVVEESPPTMREKDQGATFGSALTFCTGAREFCKDAAYHYKGVLANLLLGKMMFPRATGLEAKATYD